MNHVRYTRVIIPTIFAALILAACNFGREPAPTPLPLTMPTNTNGVDLGPQPLTVQRGDVVERLVVDGKGALGVEEDLFFGVDGRVQALHITSGDEVVAGELIAELDTRNYGFDVELSENTVELAEMQLERAQRVNAYAFDDALQALAIAELQLRELKADDNATPEDVEIQQLQVDRAQALIDRMEEGLYSSSTTDADRLTIELAQAKVNLAKREALLADMQITAPLDGEVRLFGALEVGKSVQAYDPVGVIVDPESLLIEANLVTEELEMVYEGMPVAVRLTDRPDELLTARILQLPQPFGGGVGLMTQIELEDQEELVLLRPGASVEIVVELDRVEDVLWVAPAALRGFTDNYYVEQKTGNGVREADVTVGLRNDEQVQILSGLAEGDQVVGE